MTTIKILWADDEIDLLRPHILFLESRNYAVQACQSGADALECLESQLFDIVFLDENMPGLSGLETLDQIKTKYPDLPVVMITKNEEESLMEEAIGQKIADYLIKPLNPNQILLSLKKNLDHSRLVSEQVTSRYQKAFRDIAMEMMSIKTYQDWVALYQQLIYWELELENSQDQTLLEIMMSQKTEANLAFGKFIENNYPSWFKDPESGPVLSHQLFRKYIAPELSKEQSTLLIVIDNLRYDQWRVIAPVVGKHFAPRVEIPYFSILPTATQYARNSFFSGLTPLEMKKKHPDLWKDDIDEGGKNLYEAEFLEAQFARLDLDRFSHCYHKITNVKAAQKLALQASELANYDLNVIVYNFVDTLSHAKTEVEVIKELAADDKAYRSVTNSWFSNSPLLKIIQQAQEMGIKLILTTDHGTINVKHPSKLIGDRETSINLRYKTGRSLTYNEKEAMVSKEPNSLGLPSLTMNSSFVFAKSDVFFVYPNNYNYFVNYYRNSFQHGGVSMEEMIVPLIIFDPKP